MSSQRLRTQFERLYQHFQGENSDTHLQSISELLFCTRRNTRMVISKMVEEGWVEWEPAVGRGKLSRLRFLQTDQEISLSQAKRFVAEGRLDQALAALNHDNSQLALVIQDQLGLSHQQGKQIIRLPYYRQLANLNPLKPIRRSEQHIINEIFSGLTKINEEKEEIEGDLAHHWESFSPRHWRFYLRPAIRFHDNSQLTSHDVITTFKQLQSHDLFSHIERVVSPISNVIDFYLSSDDVRFHELLGTNQAKVLPHDWLSRDDFDLLPVGTGPYKVTRNDQQRLVLEAHDYYFGYRSLVDTVEVWVLDKIPACQLTPSIEDPSTYISQPSETLTLDHGCCYVLSNRKSGIGTDPQWIKYLRSKLSSMELFSRIPHHTLGDFSVINAYGILPGWHHQVPIVEPVPVPDKRTLTVAFHEDHPIYTELVGILRELLAEDGIKLIALELPTEDVANGAQSHQIDFWVRGMSLGSKREDALLSWLYSFGEIKRVMPDSEFTVIDELVQAWRQSTLGSFPASDIGRILVQSGQVLPLYHTWVGVNGEQHGVLQNTNSNGLGWFDFSQVWMRPPLNDK